MSKNKKTGPCTAGHCRIDCHNSPSSPAGAPLSADPMTREARWWRKSHRIMSPGPPRCWKNAIGGELPGEIESLLFCVQTGIGVGVIAFFVGRFYERKKLGKANEEL